MTEPIFDYVRMSIQVPPNVKQAIESKAKENGRSASKEAVHRLAKSLGLKLTSVKTTKKK